MKAPGLQARLSDTNHEIERRGSGAKAALECLREAQPIGGFKQVAVDSVPTRGSASRRRSRVGRR
ncbi:hypothetical protein DM194_06415 [Azospirillum ramasamyi]|uniref:Uncharacterized protein n=1 Tax=Azospirillum ramasamyi TaxID=682998 RepID=A0A2U9S2P6_9PROT|nr:hypothetical protein DM194_06415 [Azospirillum ramasamyi]